MSNQNELYRDFLDRKFDELLQAIQAITPTTRNSNNEGQNHERTRTV